MDADVILLKYSDSRTKELVKSAGYEYSHHLSIDKWNAPYMVYLSRSVVYESRRDALLDHITNLGL